MIGFLFVVPILLLLRLLVEMGGLAIVKARKGELKRRADDGDRRARRTLRLARDSGWLMATVQLTSVLLTLWAGMLVALFALDAVAALLGDLEPLAGWSRAESPEDNGYARILAWMLTIMAVGGAWFVLGEHVPRRVALAGADTAAVSLSKPMTWLSWLLWPLVWLAVWSGERILRGMGVQDRPHAHVTEEELQVLIEQGTEAGVFEEIEQDLVRSVLLLSDRKISALMTPRRDIVSLDIEDSQALLRRKIRNSSYNSFPLVDGGLERVIGTIETKDILARWLSDAPLDLNRYARSPVFAPENMPALKALDMFRETRNHLILVIDEYGDVQGLVTTNDILESIVGELDREKPSAEQLEDGSWLVDGLLPVDEFKQEIDLQYIPGEEEGLFQTVGGFVTTQLGRIPTVGDVFTSRQMRVEIVEMDRHRVGKVRVIPLAAEETLYEEDDMSESES